ncbi:uncharacterized protein LOC116201643 [Punica granatum]|uniref:C2 domain-containing protein n=2 Tax=Punica granatum TaxID=22663 RepID=A0A218WM24_PUNGR|nr:uncharacterized protein LOC116201643 [Punica granatum]OWM73538.1 hypothetical protein CDL15_Pgr026637 [Punica granatum]PKI77196.1 hypothetical protein CRG98_002406 [Punica granatum]
MDSFTHHHQSGFCYDPKPSSSLGDETGDSEFSAVLEIHIHHARNIHNICIYDNQDVYAKFSLTNNPDETLSTSIIEGGGKNPDFDQRLSFKVNQPDSVLKCEMWMLSRARNYMEDQLLGFALVPLSEIAGKGKVTADYSLSSTDLFHSPAGTVRLGLSLDATSLPIDPLPVTSSITSEVVLLDRRISEVDLDPVEYSRIEFPDINVVAENQQMVSEYFTSNSGNNPNGIASFLHLGSCPINQHPLFEYEMTGNSSDNNSVSPEGSVQNSGFLSSTTTSLSDDRNSSDSIMKKGILVSQEPSTSPNPEPSQSSMPCCPDTPTSKKVNEGGKEKGPNNPNEGEGSNSKEGKSGPVNNNSFGQVFSANLEAEQSAMQQQIVGMYMTSMQQFTESLAKMKLPMDLDKLEREEKLELGQTKKDGSRVFYGSRAFF